MRISDWSSDVCSSDLVTDDSPILVTGAAGFIGHAVSERLLARGERVIGLDSFTDYYDVALKKARTARLAGNFNFRLIDGDIARPGLVSELVAAHGIRRIVHTADQAGVRSDRQSGG